MDSLQGLQDERVSTYHGLHSSFYDRLAAVKIGHFLSEGVESYICNGSKWKVEAGGLPQILSSRPPRAID